VLPRDAEVVGLDISPASLEVSRRLIANDRVDYRCDNFLTHGFDQRFDFIAMGEVIEHVEDPLAMLRRMRDCLSDDGVAFVTAPANAPAIDHIYLFTEPADIRALLKAAGFEILDETSCCTEYVDIELAIRKKLPIMYAAFVRAVR
jgi:SAM-dependent methyltransferase